MDAEGRGCVAEVIGVSSEGRLYVDLFEFSYRFVQKDTPVEHLRDE
jgi:hypothetical protein